MKNYTDWKDKNAGSPIYEALNRGTQNSVSSFGSVDQFIHGLLGPSFNKEKSKQEAPKIKDELVQKDIDSKIDQIKKEELYQEKELEQEQEEIEDTKEEIEQEDKSVYKIYKDKEENFECNISIQGAKLSNSQVRLIFDHEICNLVFYGKVYKDGKCLVPLKKMSFYPEGSSGRVKLEVIVDDTVFVPWEETFVVEGAKKVTVQIKSQKKVDVRF